MKWKAFEHACGGWYAAYEDNQGFHHVPSEWEHTHCVERFEAEAEAAAENDRSRAADALRQQESEEAVRTKMTPHFRIIKKKARPVPCPDHPRRRALRTPRGSCRRCAEAYICSHPHLEIHFPCGVEVWCARLTSSRNIALTRTRPVRYATYLINNLPYNFSSRTRRFYEEGRFVYHNSVGPFKGPYITTPVWREVLTYRPNQFEKAVVRFRRALQEVAQ